MLVWSFVMSLVMVVPMGNASNVLAYSAGAFTARMAVPAVMRSFFRSASDLTRR